VPGGQRATPVEDYRVECHAPILGAINRLGQCSKLAPHMTEPGMQAVELQAEAEDHAKFVATGAASAYPFRPMKIRPLSTRFIIPAQPVKASKPPVGTDWVHEIKHDGYRIIVRPDGPTVRLCSRNAHDWTVRLAAIAVAAQRIEVESFTIDGEAVVHGPDGLSRFEELRSREAAPRRDSLCLRPDRA
jgi:ATP-dependent DNA ligase